MTPSEFKAWFDGFTEAFTGTPTKAQWARIKARVAEIDGKPVTERVYVDRYWPLYQQTYPNWVTRYATSGVGQSLSGSAVTNTVAQNCGANSSAIALYNSHAAMGDLGRAEAQSLAA